MARCGRHSVPSADVWTWAPKPAPGPCPCAAADRFVVATETAAPEWLWRADVLAAGEQPTQAAGRRVADAWRRRLPGCTLVAVPVAGGTTVLCGQDVLVVVPGACAICLYPWLAGGGRLTDLPHSSPGAV